MSEPTVESTRYLIVDLKPVPNPKAVIDIEQIKFLDLETEGEYFRVELSDGQIFNVLRDHRVVMAAMCDHRNLQLIEKQKEETKSLGLASVEVPETHEVPKLSEAESAELLSFLESKENKGQE